MHVLDRLAALAIVLQAVVVLVLAALFFSGHLNAFMPTTKDAQVTVVAAPSVAPTEQLTATPTAALKPVFRPSSTTVTLPIRK